MAQSRKALFTSLNRDLKKWVDCSEKFKKSSVIIYARIKSGLAMMETHADRDLINRIQSQLGNFKFDK